MSGRDVKTITANHAAAGAFVATAVAGSGSLADVPPITAGMRIRQYELVRELGRGGMGQVFLARDTRLARKVALKFLTAGALGLTERFLAEARTTARCTHENIVVIHEVDEHDGMPYMVLEYLEGTPLRGLLVGERLSPSRAVEIAVPVVRALACAHEFGIVHRDLKPENVFLTSAGVIKVLDFGIAKHASAIEPPSGGEPASAGLVTMRGTVMGTVPYMSPEQLGVAGLAADGSVVTDHRTDLWALGIVLYELVTGHHPLEPVTMTRLAEQLADADRPMPSARDHVPDLPDALERIIARCLAKRPDDRPATARELVAELEALLPGRHGRRLADDESPYPGLASFQESDADRFFGRDHDVARTVARLREQPLVGIVGPSGVGKSSLVRAGVAPALKRGGEAWVVHVVRPGRAPLASLAAIADGLTAARLASEPGLLGASLRTRAARDRAKQLVFVDQLEELYTQGADDAQRRAFTACLSGVADDVHGPLRVVVAMRSDFLDRAGADPRFLDELTRGLVFLQPLGRTGLRDALTQPLEPLGYAFESPQLVDHMVDALASTPGALPLLQFAASRLWDARDRRRKCLTRAGHAAMGGVAGALATHADQVVVALAAPAQRLARAVLLRLVTPDRTRAVVDRGELRGLATEGIDALVDQLVAARLLVVQGEADATTIELVHESLITGWPTLHRWLDEGQDHAAYLAQVRTAARQWEQKGRTPGLLWRGDTEREARQFRARYRGELADRERAFLDAVLRAGTRSARIRRGALLGSIALLAAIAVGSAIALVWIQRAETAESAQARDADDARARAEAQTRHADDEAARAVKAEAEVKAKLADVQREQDRAATAEGVAKLKGSEAQLSKEELQRQLRTTEQEKAIAEQESKKAREAEALAEKATLAEKQTSAKLEGMLEQARKHTAELEERGKQITTTLPK